MLFTKDIDKKLFQQYELGSNLEKQKVIAKIFNPYGNSRWFLINSDPNDSDYIWAIVQMGDTVEVGSVSRQDLISARVGRFRFPLERDLGFSLVNAAELFRGLNQGKFYAYGGGISTFNPMELIGKYFIGKFSYGDITNIRIISDENIRIEYQTNNGLIVDKSFTKKQLFDMVNGKKIDDNIIVKPSKPMADGGETEVEEEQTVTRGFYEDEPYEYGYGGIISEIDKMIAKYQNINTREAYEAVKNLREKRNYFLAKELHEEDKLTGESEGERRAGMDNEYMAAGGEMMAKGGIYSSDNIYILKISKEGKEVGEERFRARNVKEAKEMGEDYEEKYKTKFGGDLSFSVKEAMSMGGKVTFEDKVSSIKKSLLKRKKVSPKVQKDYGKTYNKKEALESAKRIAGAIKKKYKI
jgi:hypothetical protein